MKIRIEGEEFLPIVGVFTVIDKIGELYLIDVTHIECEHGIEATLFGYPEADEEDRYWFIRETEKTKIYEIPEQEQ